MPPIKKKQIKSRSAKNKGRRLQKLVAETLSEITGIACGKDELIESRESGQQGVDVKLIGEAKKLLPLAIECKNQENWSVHSWVEQAIQNQGLDDEWVLVCKRNRSSPVVIISFDFFKKLIKILVKRNRKRLEKQ